jgi:carbonic anhydrase
MEAHFVHKDTDGQLGVVGVFLEEGSRNRFLKTLWDHLPEEVNHEETVAGVTINGSDLLPEDRSYFHFDGSLTTPPCTEAVNWYVLKNPVSVSRGQVDAFVTLIGHNARPVQPLYGRTVTLVSDEGTAGMHVSSRPKSHAPSRAGH